jgi:hypothetical protein
MRLQFQVHHHRFLNRAMDAVSIEKKGWESSQTCLLFVVSGWSFNL